MIISLLLTLPWLYCLALGAPSPFIGFLSTALMFYGAYRTQPIYKNYKGNNMKNYYGDVIVVEKRRIRVELDLDEKPTNDSVLKALRDGDFNDIMDEETYAYLSVEDVSDLETDDEEET